MKFQICLVLVLVALCAAKPNKNLPEWDLQDHDSEVKKGIPFDVIIPAAQLSLTFLQQVLNIFSNIKRVAAIGIANESGYKWEAINVHFASGTSDEVLPAEVVDKKAAIYVARKTNGPTATGAVGVLCYYIRDRHQSLCVLFSVPFDYNLYSNWWNVKIYSGFHRADRFTYSELYYGNPFKGDNGYHTKHLGNGLYLRKGVMSSSGHAKMMLFISAS